MRLIAAGLFVFVGLFATVALLGSLDVFDWAPVWIVAPALALVLFVLVGLAVWLFNRKGSATRAGKSAEEHIRELERNGLLEATEFHATRAFGVDEFEDEGLHYFLELVDGRVLFLSGQYLYDYEPISGDPPQSHRSRVFPCSEFTIRRHKTEGTSPTSTVVGMCSSQREWRRRSERPTGRPTAFPKTAR